MAEYEGLHEQPDEGTQVSIPDTLPGHWFDDALRGNRGELSLAFAALEHRIAGLGGCDAPQYFSSTFDQGEIRQRTMLVPLNQARADLRTVYVVVNRERDIDSPDMPRQAELEMQSYAIDINRRRITRSPQQVAQRFTAQPSMWEPIVGKMGPYIYQASSGAIMLSYVQHELVRPEAPAPDESILLRGAEHQRSIQALMQDLGGISLVDRVDDRAIDLSAIRQHGLQ